jgi:hypothetical protein
MTDIAMKVEAQRLIRGFNSISRHVQISAIGSLLVRTEHTQVFFGVSWPSIGTVDYMSASDFADDIRTAVALCSKLNALQMIDDGSW